MAKLLALGALAGLVALIWYLGGGSFGRAQTQAWIERVRSMPRVYGFLDRHHGKFRASAHYVEFGGLFLILYWVWDLFLGPGGLAWWPARAGILAVACAAAAWLDEMHQLRSGTRQFRRVDFLHSCCGIALAALAICYQALIRDNL
ncbi:MAG: VanZ family protein [Candidatus Sumerlaeia bacterium]|nr:VanZ family protein [Candidatus Sumerlaeia bacterium]